MLLHWSIAKVTGLPELQIYDEEGEAVAKSLGKVLRHYDVPGLNEKMADWVGLATVLGQVYGTRAIAIWDRRRGGPPPAPPGAPSVFDESLVPREAPAGVEPRMPAGGERPLQTVN